MTVVFGGTHRSVTLIAGDDFKKLSKILDIIPQVTAI